MIIFDKLLLLTYELFSFLISFDVVEFDVQ